MCKLQKTSGSRSHKSKHNHNMVPGERFELPKAQGRQIYSLMRLTTSLTRLVKYVMEPPAGFEPATPSLPWKCSTPELGWLIRILPIKYKAKIWSPREESNPQPTVYKTVALTN